MKKRISTILAVVLTLALLAGTFAMLGIGTQAEEALEPGTEIVEIGESKYQILTDTKSNAYTAISAVTTGKALGDEVSFADSAWKLNFGYSTTNGWDKNCWGNNAALPAFQYNNTNVNNTTVTSDHVGIVLNDGNARNTWSNNMFTGSTTFVDNNKLYISPTVSSEVTATQDKYKDQVGFKLSYVATQDGDIVLYDKFGKFDATGTNAAPYWANENANGTTTITIYKNGTQIWPADAETKNVISKDNMSIDFPDLGKIAVTKDDVISITYIQNAAAVTTRTGVFTAPEIAYVVPSKEIEVKVGESTYTVLRAKNYDLYSALKALTDGKEKDTEITEFGDWKISYQYLNTKGYDKSAWNSDLTYQYAATAANDALFGINVKDWSCDKKFGNLAVSFVDADKKLYVSPFVNSFWAGYVEGGANHASNSHITMATVEPAWKMTYTAPENGVVVLYDTTGKITANGAAVAPYWGNEHDDAKNKVEIYKNNTKIWPKDGDVILNKTNHTVDFPDLGEIKLLKGDQLSIIVTDDTADFVKRGGIFCSPAVAYTSKELTTQDITIGGKTYEVLIAEKYNARDTLAKLTEKLDATKINTLDMSKSAWQIATSVWNSKYTAEYAYGTGSGSSKNYPVIVGKPTTANIAAGWDTANYQTQVAIGENNLYVSPWNNDKTSKPFIDVNFVAPKSGKVVIFDNLVDITTPQKDEDPFWCWKGTANKVEVTVWKGETQIWPKAKATNNIITAVGGKITFPDLGEIKVTKGDVLTVRFAELNVANGANRDVLMTDLEVGYTKVTGGAAQTDASFATEVAVLVSVITLLGAVVITTGVIAKKRAHN